MEKNLQTRSSSSTKFNNELLNEESTTFATKIPGKKAMKLKNDNEDNLFSDISTSKNSNEKIYSEHSIRNITDDMKTHFTPVYYYEPKQPRSWMYPYRAHNQNRYVPMPIFGENQFIPPHFQSISQYFPPNVEYIQAASPYFIPRNSYSPSPNPYFRPLPYPNIPPSVYSFSHHPNPALNKFIPPPNLYTLPPTNSYQHQIPNISPPNLYIPSRFNTPQNPNIPNYYYIPPQGICYPFIQRPLFPLRSPPRVPPVNNIETQHFPQYLEKSLVEISDASEFPRSPYNSQDLFSLDGDTDPLELEFKLPEFEKNDNSTVSLLKKCLLTLLRKLF